MTQLLTPREANAAASVLVGMQRGPFGLRSARVLALLDSQVSEYLPLLTHRASVTCHDLFRWTHDDARGEITVLSPHTSSAANERHDQSAQSERQRGGLGFALSILLFLFYRSAVVGAPATSMEDLTQQFQQTASHLETRIRQHLEWLASLSLVASVDGRPDIFVITTAGRAVFPPALLSRITAASQGAHVPDEAVARFFRLTVQSTQEVLTGGESLTLTEKRALARVVVAAQDGAGLRLEFMQALLGTRDLDVILTLLDRANERYHSFVRFLYDEREGVLIALSPLRERPTVTAREADAGAAILMYLYYALGVSGDLDLPVPILVDALEGLGKRVPTQIGILESRGLIRVRLNNDGVKRVGLTPTGRAVFPPWLYELLPVKHTGGPVPVAEVASFYREHLASKKARATVAVTQMRLFEE